MINPETPKKGRPRLEDIGKSYEANKPWLAEGMSRSTWYRRRLERQMNMAREIMKEDRNMLSELN